MDGVARDTCAANTGTVAVNRANGLRVSGGRGLTLSGSRPACGPDNEWQRTTTGVKRAIATTPGNASGILSGVQR